MPFGWSRPHHQTNSNQSQLGQGHCCLFSAKTSPLGQSGGSVELEVVPQVEVAFLVEVVRDRGVAGGKRPQTSHAPEAKQGPVLVVGMTNVNSLRDCEASDQFPREQQHGSLSVRRHKSVAGL